MFFLLRAFLVVAALTYFARQPEPGRPATPMAAVTSIATSAALPALPALWEALPASARERVLRDGSADLARRLASASPSQDTLGEADRRPLWRGTLPP